MQSRQLIVLALLASHLAACSVSGVFLGRRVNGLDFHDYDSLETREQKQAAAAADLNRAFPPGTPTDDIVKLFSRYGGGGCVVLTPFQLNLDRLQGDQMHCLLSYVDPDSTIGLLRDVWGLFVQFDKSSSTIIKITGPSWHSEMFPNL